MVNYKYDINGKEDGKKNRKKNLIIVNYIILRTMKNRKNAGQRKK